jgi:mRNA-degrading endonuclease RelE of RelBE toxin-antitoxin system
MTMYRVLLERAAEKDLSRLAPQVHDRVIAAIQALATNARPPGCRKLVGTGSFHGSVFTKFSGFA